MWDRSIRGAAHLLLNPSRNEELGRCTSLKGAENETKSWSLCGATAEGLVFWLP